MKEPFSRTFTLWMLAIASSSLVCLTGGSAEAQSSSELSAMYGRGVHAYFANQIDEAEDLLSQVINAGTKDPRVYYFRAMARISCGRKYEAEQDMQVGATFEARDPGNRYAISKALERVQGAQRLTLESFRQQARMDRLQQRQQLTRERYEQLQRREPEVLRREMPVPLEDLVEPSLKLPGSGGAVMPTPAPTADPAPVGGGSQRSQPIPPAEPTDADPFGGQASDDDVFSEPSAPAAGPTPPQEPADSAEPEDNPFGEPEPSEESEEPTPPEDAVDEEDPFATSTPATDDSAVETPAAAAEDELADGDRIESSQWLGVLGRAATSVLPWRGIELPSVSPSGLAAQDGPANIELGPIEEDAAVAPASSEQPADSESASTDLFGESEESGPAQPTADPFGDPVGEVGDGQAPVDAGQAEQPQDELAPESEDPFGEF